MTVTYDLLIGGGGGSPTHTSVATLQADLTSQDSGTWTQDAVIRVMWFSSSNEVSGRLWHTAAQAGFVMEVRPYPGHGHADQADKATNALRYRTDKGACWTAADNCIRNGTGPLKVIGMRLKSNDSNGAIDHRSNADSSDLTVDQCIIKGTDVNQAVYWEPAVNGTFLARRNVIHVSRYHGITATWNGGASHTITLQGNTIVNTGAAGTTIGINVSGLNGSTSNNAIAGFNTDASWATATGSHNATDKATGGLPSSGRQNDLVGTTEWESVTTDSEDLRVKSTSAKLANKGTTIGLSTDIIGQSMTGTYDIGAWESTIEGPTGSRYNFRSIDSAGMQDLGGMTTR